MKADGLRGVCRRKWDTTTTRDANAQPSADLVQRQFVADGPNKLWVADITYIPTWAGFLFLAVVLDAFSRKIVGWAMAEHLRTELVLAALNMALGQRRPREVVHHSDHGTQYTSIAFGLRCKEAGVRPSMGSVGDAYDNAMCESSSRRWNANSSTDAALQPRQKRGSPCSSSSRPGTTSRDVIRVSAGSHRTSSKALFDGPRLDQKNSVKLSVEGRL